MKSLKLLRVFLQIMVMAMFQIHQGNHFNTTLALITAANAFFLLFLITCRLSGRKKLEDSLYAEIVDILILSLYLVYVNPLWLLSFILIHTVNLVFSEEERATGLFLFLMITSFLGIIIYSYLTGDMLTVLFMMPSYGGLLYFFRVVREKQNHISREHQYLRQLVANKNNLLSTLTHELRTPLAVIKTSTELLLEERPGAINDTQKTLLNSSFENTKRMTALVENILSQVKVEFAWFTMKKKPLDIRPIIRKIALDIKPYLETRKQSLHYNYPGLLSRTLADERWLQQVLLNLIHNASKNSPEGAELEVAVNENEQCIVVSVHDGGLGIRNEEIPYVFKEFYQSEDPSKNLNDGAGLGLTIVRDIIEKHGGNVYISSLPGRGTTVSFSLPVHKGAFSDTHGSGN